MVKSKAWTEEEVNFLKMYFKDHSISELAEALERTEGSIKFKIEDLKLLKHEKLIPSSEDNKICSKCKTEKPKSEFSCNKKTKDKLNGWCKDCCNNSYKLYIQNKRIDKQKAAIERIKEETGKEMKRCTKCGELKPGTEFYFIHSRKGRESACIECQLKRKKNQAVERIKKGTYW